MEKRLRVLFFANRIPYPPYRGDKLKIYNLASRLKDRHELHLITFAQTRAEFDYRGELEKIFDSVTLLYLPKWRSIWNCILALNPLGKRVPFQVAYFRHPKMNGLLDSFLSENPIDVIHVQHMRMAQYMVDRTQYPRILDLPDAFSLYWERRKKVKRPLINRIFDAVESRRVLRYEKVASQFDLNLACSIEDIGHLRKTHPGPDFELLRNGVNLDTFRFEGHDYKRTGTLLFTGNMDYAPNVDAVGHFVKNMLPRIREKCDVRLVIAGQRPVQSVLDLASEYVEVTGFVEDLSKMYSDADVVIAPLRFGAGTQNKVLESLAMGVPVVCTNIGFEGLEVQSGEGVFLGKTDEEFIQHCVALLESADLRETTGSKGLQVARERFSWDVVSTQLEEYLLGLKTKTLST